MTGPVSFVHSLHAKTSGMIARPVVLTDINPHSKF